MAEEKFLTRIQKLLDKANANGTTEQERQLLLDKADELMLKHAIDAAMLDATLTRSERRAPVKERFHAADPNAPHFVKFRTLMRLITRLHRVRVAFYSNGDVALVGFRDDVEYVQMKWLNAYLHFSSTINPRWDASLPMEQNVYNFKIAGYKWQEIHELAVEFSGCTTTWWNMKGQYRKWCKKIGEEPTQHTQRNFAYRESFATAFVNRLAARIEQLVEDRNKMETEAGALIAVKDLTIEVDEMFYGLFPNQRPMSAEAQARMEADIKAQAERERQELLAKLEAMTPAQRAAYDAEQEREWAKQERFNKRYWRAQDKKFDHEGASRGRASADQVDLNRNAATDTGKRGEL